MKTLLLGLISLGLFGQNLTNYSQAQFDQGTSIPGSCSMPGFFWLTTTSRLYICNASHAFVVDNPTATSLFSQTATGTVANTTTETTLTATGSGSLTIPANFFVAGTTVKLIGWGFHSAAASPNLTINFKLGGTTVATTGAVATNNSTNQMVDVEVYITCRTTGSSGTFFIQGGYREWVSNGSNRFQMVNTTTTTIDTTSSQAVDLTATWSAQSISDTISLTNLNLDQIR